MRILFVDIDTLRPDHMSCYGYGRKTTPNIDQVAQEGICFDQYYCSDAPCLPSRASLISGMFGIRNGAVGHGGTAADRRLTGPGRDFKDRVDLENFNNIFRRAGMHTVSVSTFPERHSSWWFNAGFHETYNVGKCGGESGEEVLPPVLDWLSRKGSEDNWFLHVHFWDPHTPYRTPADFDNPFENQPLAVSWIDEENLKKHIAHTGPHSINEISMYNDFTPPEFPKQPGKASNLSEVKYIFDQYDGGILYTDQLVGKIFDKLRQMGIYDDTAIIVTSDHGENFGELGLYCEHGTADYPTCHIPFILKWPNSVKNYHDNELHYSLDLLPTMADLLQVKKSPHWDGESYHDTIISGGCQGRSSLVISQMAHVCQRSARFGDWLYMRTYHDGFHLFDKEMLYNIKEDPYEQTDCKMQYPDICAQGAKIILDWQDEMMSKSDSVVDPLWTVMKEGGPYHTWNSLDRYLQRLENTGRSEGAKQLREKYKK